MIEFNPFHYTGKKTMERTGLTSEEHAVSQNEHLSFEEKVEKSKPGAEILINNSRFITIIDSFTKEKGGLQNLTEDTCETFLNKHPDCPYSAEMIIAIAEKIEEMRKRAH